MRAVRLSRVRRIMNADRTIGVSSYNPAMTAVGERSQYSLREEIAHSVTHGLGIVLSIAGLIAMVLVSERTGDVRHVVASVVYGLTLILLYLGSTPYHGLPSPGA